MMQYKLIVIGCVLIVTVDYYYIYIIFDDQKKLYHYFKMIMDMISI